MGAITERNVAAFLRHLQLRNEILVASTGAMARLEMLSYY